jgi:hypothetical protein
MTKRTCATCAHLHPNRFSCAAPQSTPRERLTIARRLGIPREDIRWPLTACEDHRIVLPIFDVLGRACGSRGRWWTPRNGKAPC